MARFVPDIDMSKVPRVDMNNLAQDLLRNIKRYYEDPENLRKFEEWKRARDAERENQGA